MTKKEADEMNYSLYDNNGDRYDIVIKKKDLAKYEYGRAACYNALKYLKKAGQKPTVSGGRNTVADHGPDDLRSPEHKKAKRQKAKKIPAAAASVFKPLADSTFVESAPADTNAPPAVRSLNASFDASLIIKDDNLPTETVLQDPHDDVEVEVLAENPNLSSSWNDMVVHTFVNLMGKHIAKFIKPRTPSKVYDNISEDMKTLGYNFSASELKEKKRSLDSYYYKERKKGNSKWVFFEGLNHINQNKMWPQGFESKPTPKANSSSNSIEKDLFEDIDGNAAGGWDDEGAVGFDEAVGGEHNHTAQDNEAAAFRLLSNEEEVNHNVGQGKTSALQLPVENFQEAIYNQMTLTAEPTKVWGNLASDKAMLEEVAEARDHFADQPLTKNEALFKHVAAGLRSRGYDVEGITVRIRYANVLARFRIENDKIQNTGGGGCTWELFDDMYELEKNSVTTKPKVTVSAGVASTMQKAEAAVKTLQVGRTRLPTANRVERAKKLMGPAPTSKTGAMGFKNRALEIQEERRDMERTYLDHFSTYLQQSRVRMQQFGEVTTLLREMKDQVTARNTDKDHNNNNGGTK